MSLTLDLFGKKALVTGVTSGIGASIAAMLGRAGCDVAGCGRSALDSEAALSFQRIISECGRYADYRLADLTEPDAAQGWVLEAATALGGCDVLVSNAGRNVFESVTACSEAAWSECMNLDLAAH